MTDSPRSFDLSVYERFLLGLSASAAHARPSPAGLCSTLVQTACDPSLLPHMHPQGQHWSAWKSTGVAAAVACEVATNLARANEIREQLRQATHAASVVLPAAAFVNPQRLQLQGCNARPRIELWAQLEGSGDLCVYFEPVRDSDASRRIQEGSLPAGGLEGTDYLRAPRLDFSGDGPANLLVRLPAQLIEAGRGHVASRALVVSKQEVARAVVSGLVDMAQQLQRVCRVTVQDWVVHDGAGYRLMSPTERVSLRMSQVLETVEQDARACLESVHCELQDAGVKTKRARSALIARVLAGPAKDDDFVLEEALRICALDRRIEKLSGRFGQLRQLLAYGRELSALAQSYETASQLLENRN